MKKFIFSALLVSTFTFTSCLDHEIETTEFDFEDSSVISGNLTSDLTLSSNLDYVLNGSLFVTEGATLTIEEGVTINALAGRTDIYILVERGATIDIQGTATNPVRITSNSSEPATGDWGGLILNGYAPISGTAESGNEAGTEVNSGILFGGTDVADSSGSIEYLILEYTGARIDGDAEHNGLTLNGVGNGTLIDNVAILNGDDDAIEFFGGSVDVSNLLVVNAKDDMFDFTQGYTGNCSNFYGIREAGFTAVTSDPRGIEADGNLDGNNPSAFNQSDFTLDRVTIINNGVDFSDAIKVRRGATANITNAYVEVGVDATYSDFIDLEDSKGNATSSTIVSAIGNPANGVDINDIKNTPAAIITTTTGTTGGADTSAFDWTGYF